MLCQILKKKKGGGGMLRQNHTILTIDTQPAYIVKCIVTNEIKIRAFFRGKFNANFIFTSGSFFLFSPSIYLAWKRWAFTLLRFYEEMIDKCFVCLCYIGLCVWKSKSVNLYI